MFMGKTNFTKVEDSLRKGMENFAIKKIVDSTDSQLKEKKAAEEIRLSRKKIAIYLIGEIKRLKKGDDRLFSKLGLTLVSAKKMLEHPLKLTDDEWKSVLKLKDKVEAYKKAYAKSLKTDTIEELVEKERDKQADRRFNIQKKWLPID